MDTPSKPAALPLNVKVLGGVSFLNDLASDMIYPLLPLFLTQVLGAGPVSLGLIEGVAESAVSFFKLISGYASDRFKGRKRWIVLGYGASNLVRPLMAFANAWGTVFLLRFFDRIGKGFRTSPRDALIAESVDPTQRGRAFGFHRSLDHAGAVVGPLVAAGLLAMTGGDLRSVFLLSAVPGALCLILVIVAVRESSAVPRGPRTPPVREAWSAVPPEFKRYLVVLGLFTLANASDAFLILKARKAGVSIAWIPVLWSFFHLIKSLTVFWGGHLSDRWGRKRLLVGGWLVYAVVYAGFGYVESAWHIWALFAVYGTFFGLTEGVERALVADLSPGGLKGSVFGLYHLTTGIGSLLASIVFGLVWSWVGDRPAFLAAGLLAAASAVILSQFRFEPRPDVS